jgi:MmyB-like transcription regulator ligand binding domain
VADLLRRIPEAGAVVTDASYDVIAWNPLAEALVGNLADEPNLARRRFLEPSLGRSSGGEEFSHIVVARLRGAADRYPSDQRLARLLAELRAGSEEFVQVWDTNPVRAPGHRSKTLTHPEIGAVRIECDVLAVPDDDQQVVFMTADPGTPSARALRHLLRRVDSAAGQVA